MENQKLHTITEYQGFFCSSDSAKAASKYRPLEKTQFNQLKEFVLENNGKNKGADGDEFQEDDGDERPPLMKLSSSNGYGEVLTAKNYVGVIAMKDGTQYEILPKIFSEPAPDAPEDVKKAGIEKTKDVFLRMLRTVQGIPFVKCSKTYVSVRSMSMLDLFVRSFIDDVFQLVKRGLKSSYVRRTGNEHFFKGKLVCSEQIKRNCIHKERFFISYDDFCLDRPENRLIKSTLSSLRRIPTGEKNRHDIAVLNAMFDEIGESKNVDADFAKSASDRSVADYTDVLAWCRVFLKNQSFTTFSGKSVAFAFLFPMEKVFESYVGQMLRRQLGSDFDIRLQDTGKYLFYKPKGCFALKPDIVLRDKSSKEVTILDTKWKRLTTDSSKNYGISQSDMYQMYAYGHKYQSRQVILLYPLTEETRRLYDKYEIFEREGKGIMYYDENDKIGKGGYVCVKVRLVDLWDQDDLDIQRIAPSFCVR